MVRLIRSHKPSEISDLSGKCLNKILHSCNNSDVVKIILGTCQKSGYWKPVYVNDIYSNSIKYLVSNNFIDSFGNGDYCLTNKTIDLLYKNYK